MRAAWHGDPIAVVVTGLPGTGKSTLADALARRMDAPSFSGDWLMGALAPAHRAWATLDRATSLAAYHSLLWSLASRQLMLGQSAVLDCIVTDELASMWRAQADRLGGSLSVVECICGDEDVHRERLEHRVRDIPGWHEVGWDHVERMRAEFPPLTVDRIVVDAVEPADHNLRLVAAAIGV